ncbi:MAG: DUF1311 domain-containing protein [Oceanospirillales bacterium]|nr:DUF1311 domain-containing protein [Oceanospirillales bacterium]
MSYRNHKKYEEDDRFIKAFKESQNNWHKQLELDLKMKFPEENKSSYYGSIFPVCYYTYRMNLVKERIRFLQEWTNGHEQGDICGGSVMYEYFMTD